ncbi:MAG: hypothetical protein R6V32_12170 [Bacteroidales bacterium]
MNKPVLHITIVLLSVMMCACNNQNEPGFVFDAEESQKANIDSLIRSMPSYEDITMPMRKADINFQARLINTDPLPVPEKHSQTALQTGIMLSDMAYCRYFEQVHKAMFLSSQIEERMKHLHIPSGQMKQITIELESHMYSRDTVVNILSDAYAELTDGLIEGQRTALAGLIMTGAWIESSRLMLGDTSLNDDMASKHWDRSLSVLSSLLPLIDAFESGIPESLPDKLHEISEVSERNIALKKIEALQQEIYKLQENLNKNEH